MMSTTAAKLAAQRRIDEEILFYIREMQSHGPMTLAAVHAYIHDARRLDANRDAVLDRLEYQVSKGNLKADSAWDAGETVRQYTITAKGRDILDGALPPDA